MPTPGPRIAVCGTFEAPRLADLLAGRLLVRELLSRLPGAGVEALAPGPEVAAHPLDGGLPASPLGRPGPPRDAALADRFDLLVVVDPFPGEAPAPDPSLCPVVRLGSDPDPLLLAARSADRTVLERRRRFLAHMGWWPSDPAIVVAGDVASLPRLDDIVAALSAVGGPVVLLTGGPAEGDGPFLDALAARLPGARRPEHPTLEEMQAALAGARAVIAGTRGALQVARSFGVPTVAPGPDLAARLLASLGTTDPLVADELLRLDARLDEVAMLSRASAELRRPGSTGAAAEGARDSALSRAFEEQGRLFGAERLRLAERIERLSAGFDPEEVRRGLAAQDELALLRRALDETEARRRQVEEWLESNVAAHRQTSGWLDSTEAERKRLAAALADAESALETARAELTSLRSSRILRFTAPVRALAARLRRP